MKFLKSKARRAFAIDFLGTFLNGILTFIISIILARILTPEDFGVMAVALALVALSTVLVDGGFSKALIQDNQINSISINSVFFFNLTIGLVLTILVFVIAKPLSLFYENSEIERILKFVSPIFILHSLTVVPTALFEKNLNFKPLVLRRVIGAGLSGILAIGLAYSGFGVYSLVAQHLSAAFIIMCVLWLASSWRPKMEFSSKEIMRLGSFGGYIIFNNLVTTLFKRLDVFLLGKLISAGSLGYYTRGLSLKEYQNKYLTATFRRVFFPVLSNLQENEDQFHSTFLKVTSLLGMLSYTLAAILYVGADEIVIGLYGNQWSETIPLFELMILGACNYPINAMIVNAFNAKGYARLNFKIGLIRKALSLLPFILLIQYSLTEFLVAQIVVSFVSTLMNSTLLSHFVGVSFRAMIKDIYLPILPAGLFLAFYEIMLVEHVMNPGPIILSFVILIGLWLKLTANPGFGYFVEFAKSLKRKNQSE
jgi:O-antigen/teichoic acid export membrane protein